jgi:predicted nucleic acid-binding protein
VTIYVDASVLLRVILGEPGRLRQWAQITRPIASVLIRVECLRTIERARGRLRLDDHHVATHRAAVLEQVAGFELVPIDSPILERAGDPFATALGSFDAIHLATALLARTALPDLRLATHDLALATAARASGFNVLGV